MIKNKLTPAERRAVIKRGTKRSMRLKKTQKQKNRNKAALIEEKKRLLKKENEEIEKILKSRDPEFNSTHLSNQFPATFTKYVHLVFWKKSMKLKKQKEKQAEKEQ